MKNTFGKLHDAFHIKEKPILASDNRSMSETYKLDPSITGMKPAIPANAPAPMGTLAAKKPQTAAQHSSVEKAAAASVAKRRGLMPLTTRTPKGRNPGFF
jgi:hypothetical protein